MLSASLDPASDCIGMRAYAVQPLTARLGRRSYGERIGALNIVVKDPASAVKIRSQLNMSALLPPRSDPCVLTCCVPVCCNVVCTRRILHESTLRSKMRVMFRVTDLSCRMGWLTGFGSGSSITRAMISNPPLQGARLVAAVISNPDLYKQWDTSAPSPSLAFMVWCGVHRQRLLV